MKSNSLRKSGLRMLGPQPWGSHFSLFYETKEDLFETVVPYLKAGLTTNEYCMWVVSEPVTEHEAREALLQLLPARSRHRAERRLEILSGRDWYRKGHRLDLARVAT